MDAVHIKNCVLAAFAAVGTVAAQALGGWDAAMQVLVALMAADYLTGVLVAAVWQRSRKTESGALDSKAGYIGLLKKGTGCVAGRAARQCTWGNVHPHGSYAVLRRQ